jgi:hypothetical protein
MYGVNWSRRILKYLRALIWLIFRELLRLTAKMSSAVRAAQQRVFSFDAFLFDHFRWDKALQCVGGPMRNSPPRD